LAQVLARKYRPRNFKDLVGQEAIAKTLSLALDNNKLSHAYLFSGIRGGGKTSTARIFAKALLCEKGPTSNPCEECNQCKMANEGRHIDIIELDAASNRGIDDIKELIEQTKYKPSIGKYKIFIIDEVHMLTTQAFNALLKTLEEPPEFVKFILATTDPLKLPATILSRVQHFRFKKIPQKIVKNHLAFILNKEGIDFEENALEIIARSGQGSIRDSLTLLDQAIVYANGTLTTDIVVEMLGVVDPKELDKLLDALLEKDKNKIIEFIHKFSEYETEMIIDELTIYLKELLFNDYKKLSTLVIDRFFRILSEAKNLLTIGSEGEFVLTLTLFKMLEALNILEIDEAIEQLQKELSTQNIASATLSTQTEAQIVQSESFLAKKEDEPIKKQEKNTALKGDENKENVDNNLLKFKKLIEKIYDRNFELGEVFEKNVTFLTFHDGILHLESQANEQERMLLRNGWNIIKLFTQELFGIDVKIKVTQKKTLDNKEKLKKNFIEAQKDEELRKNETKTQNIEEQKSSCIMPQGTEEASLDKDPQELLNEPMIKKIIENFNPKRVVVKSKT
jgi:DNA polymerase-3 subunit gamma/tau